VDKEGVRKPGLKSFQRLTILTSILVKIAVLALLLPYVTSGFRLVLIAIFAAAIAAQVTILWKQMRRRV